MLEVDRPLLSSVVVLPPIKALTTPLADTVAAIESTFTRPESCINAVKLPPFETYPTSTPAVEV